MTEMELILMQVKEKTGLRCAMLEQKLGQLVHVLEARETQIYEMVIAMNADPVAVTEAKKHLEVGLCTFTCLVSICEVFAIKFV